MKDGHSDVPPVLGQPVATGDAADFLADIATNHPLNAIVEIAGPERHDLVDLARQIQVDSRNAPIVLVPSWAESGLGVEMAGELLLPHAGAHLGTTTFQEWLRKMSGPDYTE